MRACPLNLKYAGITRTALIIAATDCGKGNRTDKQRVLECDRRRTVDVVKKRPARDIAVESHVLTGERAGAGGRQRSGEALTKAVAKGHLTARVGIPILVTIYKLRMPNLAGAPIGEFTGDKGVTKPDVVEINGARVPESQCFVGILSGETAGRIDLITDAVIMPARENGWMERSSIANKTPVNIDGRSASGLTDAIEFENGSSFESGYAGIPNTLIDIIRGV